jgi:hypothetical protein
MPWSVTIVSPLTAPGHDLALEATLVGRAGGERCERSASSSCSERGISQRSAIISAERPCGIRR